MKILEELWLGNVNPQDSDSQKDPRIEQALSQVVKNEDALRATLTDIQKEQFEKFRDCQSDLEDFQERRAYRGVLLGDEDYDGCCGRDGSCFGGHLIRIFYKKQTKSKRPPEPTVGRQRPKLPQVGPTVGKQRPKVPQRGPPAGRPPSLSKKSAKVQTFSHKKGKIE